MFSQEDLKQLATRGLTVDQVSAQLKQIKDGFPFLRIESAAAVGHGIMSPSADECAHYQEVWTNYLKEGHSVVKFVPASGAASRMFKNLFAFLSAPYEVPTTDFEKEFFVHISKFAFYEALSEKCKENDGKSIDELIAAGCYKAIVANLLTDKGLDYGQLPKGLLLFHRYADGSRTPMEEHLVEAALYASSNGEANVHFTVSHNHLQLFEQMVKDKVARYEEKYHVHYNITFSEQKPSTDTIAANPDNTPFRDEDGSLLFRPGGHGALIENLNEIGSDIVFIKNIDNVVPDRLKESTVDSKQLLAGVLVDLQKRAFEQLRKLDAGNLSHEELVAILAFVENELCCKNEQAIKMTDAELALYLRQKLNRPMRVCGVVKNVGEPGGGPFLVYNADGSVSAQILESSQIDTSNATYMKMFTEGTHFNPVDLVCAVKDYEGKAFCLPDYVDASTGFISSKSKNGRELKAYELPGLWNGAMSNWNTVFVEVPLSTFNPVKTVNDLLREQHQ